MSGDICHLCFEKSEHMKHNFQEIIENSNIQEFVENFCQFVFNDSICTLDEICMKCWQALQQFNQFCEKIRGIHQHLVEETPINLKPDEQTEILEDDGDGDGDGDADGEDNSLEGYDYQKTPLLAIETDLGEDGEGISRRAEITPKIVKNLEDQLKFEATIIDLAEMEFERFARFIPMVCGICKCQFDSFDECHDHYLYLHNRAAVWNCCNLLLETPYDALDHIKYHESIDVFKCAACFKCFLTSNKLKYHIRRTHLPAGSFECTLCEKTCKSLRLLLNHQRSHIRIACPHCKKQISASSYDHHIRIVHACMPTKRKAVEKSHLNSKKKKGDEKLVASSSKTSNQLRNVAPTRTFAISTEPNENGMYECDICRMEFKQISLVFSHRNKVHV